MKQFPIATPTKEEFLTFFGEKDEVKMNKIAQKDENTEEKKMNEATRAKWIAKYKVLLE